MPTLSVVVVAVTLLPGAGGAPALGAAAERERVLAAAAEIMRGIRNCTLITLDPDGAPQARAMDPFLPEADLTVWLATNASTRKVGQIRRDPRVTLHYFDPAGPAYVTLIGDAALVDDAREKERRYKPEWKEFYLDENRGDDYLLIRVSPRRVEVMSAPHDIAMDPLGWKPAIVELR